VTVSKTSVADEERYVRGWWRRDRTFLDDFLDGVLEHPGKVAIVARSEDAPSGSSVTYSRLGQLVDRIAFGLLDRGIRRGEVVSFQLPNWWEFTALTLACARVGAIANPILPILRRREVRFILDALKTRMCFVPYRFRGFPHAEMMLDLRAELPELTDVVVVRAPSSPSCPRFEDSFTGAASVKGRSLAELEVRRPGPDDVAQVQFTSGTTGRPKGVVHTYNTLYAGYRALIDQLSLTSEDVVLVPSTMAHQTGFLNGCVMPMAEGMKAVYQETWDADVMLALIESERVTYASGAAPFLADACAAMKERRRSVWTLRYFRSGGAPVPAGLVREASELLGAQIVVSWGMTENGICTLSRKDSSPQEIAATDGYPAPWVQLKIVGRDGQPQESGCEGVLKVRSASQCVDYVPDHAEFASAFDRDGFFDTGDLARINPDGSVRITGRVKEMIIRGGENVPVVEVERALAGHPAIEDVALVGVPDARLGERACAVVVRAPFGPEPDLPMIQNHLRSLGMAAQFWPEYLVLREALPRTAAGKVRKTELRDTVAVQLALAPPGSREQPQAQFLGTQAAVPDRRTPR
jgi:cyclohexanecarboxylate-CoA ligase